MKKEFPVHFVDKKRDIYYRIDGVKEIDTKTGKAFYKGATVYNDALVGWYASDTVTFYIASWKDMEEITGEEFNTKYNNVKNDFEPKWYGNMRNGHWFHAKSFKLYGSRPCYYGVTVDPHDLRIFGNMEFDDWTLEHGGWYLCTKEEYENALNKVLNKIK